MNAIGRVCFKILPSGITSAPDNYQKRILRDLLGVLRLIDDVCGSLVEEHNMRTRTVFHRIENSEVTSNIEKSDFAKSSYLRHIVSVYRVISDTVKVREITEMQHPINVSYTFVVFWARIISYRLTSNIILVRNTKVLALYGPHKVTTVSAVSIRLETVVLQSDAT